MVGSGCKEMNEGILHQGIHYESTKVILELFPFIKLVSPGKCLIALNLMSLKDLPKQAGRIRKLRLGRLQ